MGQLVKRIAGRVLPAAVLGLVVLFAKPESVAAVSETEVYADAVRLRAGESVKIPVYIKNNAGVMGYLLTAEYDPEKVEINDISTGPCFANGLFEHNLSLQQKGRVDILWSNTQEVKEDGILLYFEIRAKEDIGEAKTQIRLTDSEEDTFNEKYENVSWNCAPIEIQGGGHAVASPDRKSDSRDAADSGKQKPTDPPPSRRPENTASKKDSENKDRGSGQPGNGQLESGQPGSGGQSEESWGAAGAQPADHKDARPSGMDSQETQERGATSLKTEYAERIMAEAGLVFLVLVLCAPK